MNSRRESARRSSEEAKRPAAQFSIAAVMWTTFALAAVLGYLRSFGLGTAGIGLAVMLATAVVAAIIGSITRQMQQVVFWGLLGAAFAFTCVIGATTMSVFMQVGWGMAGGVAGAVCGVVSALKQQPRWSVLAGAVTGMLIIGGCCIYRGAFTLESIVDVLGAAIACGGLAIVIEVIRQIEQKFQTPRHRTAAGLIFAVVAGNLFADWIMRSY